MRAIAVGLAVASILFLVSAGHLIFVPLLFVPLSLLSLRRGRDYFAALRSRPLDLRRRTG